MSGIAGLLDTVVAGAAVFALETLWKVSLVLLAGGGLAWLFRKQSSALRHLVWTCAVAASLFVPVAVMLAPSWRVRVPNVVALPPIARAPEPAAREQEPAPRAGTQDRQAAGRTSLETSIPRSESTPTSSLPAAWS